MNIGMTKKNFWNDPEKGSIFLCRWRVVSLWSLWCGGVPCKEVSGPRQHSVQDEVSNANHPAALVDNKWNPDLLHAVAEIGKEFFGEDRLYRTEPARQPKPKNARASPRNGSAT